MAIAQGRELRIWRLLSSETSSSIDVSTSCDFWDLRKVRSEGVWPSTAPGIVGVRCCEVLDIVDFAVTQRPSGSRVLISAGRSSVSE